MLFTDKREEILLFWVNVGENGEYCAMKISQTKSVLQNVIFMRLILYQNSCFLLCIILEILSKHWEGFCPGKHYDVKIIV